MKICSKCQVEKPLVDFYLHRKKNPYSFCKICWNEKIKLHRLNNPGKVKENYHSWYLKNWGKKRAANKAWKKMPGESQTLQKLADRLRNRVYQALCGIHKSAATLKLLGCSVKELKSHLQSLFAADMTWENYGDWHIDHVKPCAKFDLTDPEQQKACFHYSNLQPLWAIDNLKKHAKYGGH